ncbi:RES family NAD+ phosphorylase [Janibacter hoylei]|uniref:RES family NAD+ phosphorylase n=1 Tax=Janibacter hoylei TaxID=364298 RepID=UPI0034D31684
MGAPPKHIASAGRANPVGIPYLYLAYSIETCLYETRASIHSSITVGRFQPTRQLNVLNLADIDPPDFFSIPDVDSVDDQISQVAMHRYLRALSRELTKPVRSSDEPTDYIPTQYLCEFAKAQGLDGVLYSSSLHPGGRNLVLFDTTAAACVDASLIVEITSLKLQWESLASTTAERRSSGSLADGED